MTWPCWDSPGNPDWPDSGEYDPRGVQADYRHCLVNVPTPYGGSVTWTGIGPGQHTMRIEALDSELNVVGFLEETWSVQ